MKRKERKEGRERKREGRKERGGEGGREREREERKEEKENKKMEIYSSRITYRIAQGPREKALSSVCPGGDGELGNAFLEEEIWSKSLEFLMDTFPPSDNKVYEAKNPSLIISNSST